jgi:hypothetical protein
MILARLWRGWVAAIGGSSRPQGPPASDAGDRRCDPRRPARRTMPRTASGSVRCSAAPAPPICRDDHGDSCTGFVAAVSAPTGSASARNIAAVISARDGVQ